MGLAAAFLWPLTGPPGTTLAGALIGIPFLAGFLRDGLAAGGLLDTGHPAYLRWKARLGRLAFAWTPPVLRAAAGAAAALRIAAALAAGLGAREAPQAGPGAVMGAGLNAALGAWRAAVAFLPAAIQPAAAALAATLQLAALAVLAAGHPRRVLPACALVVLLSEGLSSFQGPWDPLGAMALGAALLLLLLRPAPRRSGAPAPRNRPAPAAGPVTARPRRAG
jgi:hypothetical protein